MKLSSAGRVALKRQAGKDPNKVAKGKASAEERLSRGWDPKSRTSHLGYDCYATGQINQAGKIRIVLRSRRLPPNLPADVTALLPPEMWWPERDHAAAHALVDAVLKSDIGSLRKFKASWPDHEFGVETFIRYAEGAAASVRQSQPVLSPLQEINPAAPADQGGRLPDQLTLFPVAVDYAENLFKVPFDGYQVWLQQVYFVDGSQALGFDVWGVLADGQRLLCSRAFVDANTGRYQVMVHRPAVLKGLGLPVDLLHTHLGIKRSARAVDRARMGEGAVRPAPGESMAVREARHVHAVLAVGGPTTERVQGDPKAPVQDLEAVPGGSFAPEAFPAAPT